MAVASGDLRRRKEAMDHLVIDISKGDEENISSAIRIAIEVILNTDRDFHSCSSIHEFCNKYHIIMSIITTTET
jgi:hypothetical protein